MYGHHHASTAFMTKQTQRLHLDEDASRITEIQQTLRAARATLVRPLAVIGGWRSPPMMSNVLARRLSELTTGNRGDIFAMSYALSGSIEGAASRLRAKLIPWLASRCTNEVDIVAISMGGLVARHLAMSGTWIARSDRFKIRRLFTIATPHQGASLARWFKLDLAAMSMTPGSARLRAMDACLANADDHADELTCYVQRQDWYIGTWNAAPEGRELRWVHPPSFVGTCMSHFTAHQHKSIITDIALRLRGETPLAAEPADS
jgi:pimeloyl-ACP methyl ester carboxylesterase